MGVRKTATQNILSGDQIARVPCYGVKLVHVSQGHLPRVSNTRSLIPPFILCLLEASHGDQPHAPGEGRSALSLRKQINVCDSFQTTTELNILSCASIPLSF